MNTNTFQDYWNSLQRDQQANLAKLAKTSTGYLYQISSGRRNAGWKTIQKLISADNNIKIEMFSD